MGLVQGGQLSTGQQYEETSAGVVDVARREGGVWRWGWLLIVLAAAAAYPALIWNSAAVAFDAAHVHIYRALVFSGAISDGAIYPRWAQFFHYGLGSPVFTFYPPLPFYALDVLARLGLAQPLGWRVLMAAGLLAACWGTYLLVHALTGQHWPAVLAGVAYLYAPYTLRNALERGSNEAYAAFLYPWVLWALLRLGRRPAPGRFVVATLLWAATIGTHVLGPLMLAPVAGLFALWLAWRYRTATPLLALVAGIALTAAIWAPMLQERAYVHFERDFQDVYALPAANPIPLDHLFAPPAVYDVARDNNDTGDRAGLPQLLLLLLGIPGTIYAWARGRRELAVFLGAATLLGLGLLWSFTGAADFLWRAAAPVLNLLQYRSRLMALQALAVAVVAGLCLALLPQRRQPVIALLLSAILIGAALPSLYINLRHLYAPFGAAVTWDQVRATEFTEEDSALTAFGEMVPRWRDIAYDQKIGSDPGPQFDPTAAPVASAPEGLRVMSSDVRAGRWDLVLAAQRAGPVTLHLLYYPRWQAWIDGARAELRPQAGTGYAQLDLPAGEHAVALTYGSTPVETAALAIAGLTLLALVAYAAGAFRVRALAGRGGRAQGPPLQEQPADTTPAGDSVEHTSSPGTAEWSAGETQRSKDQKEGSGTAKSVNFASSRLRVGAACEGAERSWRPPPLWLLLGLTVLLGFKVLYMDGHTTWLRCVSSEVQVCGAQRTTSVTWPGGIRLRGFSLPAGSVAGGSELRVPLFWQADSPIHDGQYSYLRLRSAEGGTDGKAGVEARHEGPGGFFTTAYVPGKLYQDEYRIALPAELAPGQYQVEIGWYDVATGDEVPLPAGNVPTSLSAHGQSLVLGTVVVK